MKKKRQSMAKPGFWGHPGYVGTVTSSKRKTHCHVPDTDLDPPYRRRFRRKHQTTGLPVPKQPVGSSWPGIYGDKDTNPLSKQIQRRNPGSSGKGAEAHFGAISQTVWTSRAHTHCLGSLAGIILKYFARRSVRVGRPGLLFK